MYRERTHLEGNQIIWGFVETADNASLTLDVDTVNIDVTGGTQATGIQTENGTSKITVGRSTGTLTHITAVGKTNNARGISSYANGGEVTILGKTIELEARSEANGSAWTILANNNDTINIGDENIEKVTLKAYSKDNFAVSYSCSSGNTTVNGHTINFEATGKKSRAIEMSGAGQLAIGNENSIVNITAGVSPVLSESSQIPENEEGIGIFALKTGSLVAIDGAELNITDYGHDARGLLSQNNNDQVVTPPEDAATIKVTADKTTIQSQGIGIASYSGSRQIIDSNLTINAPIAIEARGKAEVNVWCCPFWVSHKRVSIRGMYVPHR